MKIGIIACETFKRGLEVVLKDDPDIVHKEYLEFGLHEYPEELKKAVISKVNALEGEVDAVFLAYGICNSLKDVVKEMTVPTVTMDAADDCIGVLITPGEYEKERKKCAGTMYHTPYFALMGREWFEKKVAEQMPNYKEIGLDIDWYMRTMFDGYSRVLFIDDGLDEIEKYRDLSKQFASELNFIHESRSGTLEILWDGVARTKELARVSSAIKTEMSENGVEAHSSR